MWLNENSVKDILINEETTKEEEARIQKQIDDVKEDTKENLNDIVKTSILGYNMLLFSEKNQGKTSSEIKHLIQEMDRNSILPIYNLEDKINFLNLFSDGDAFLNHRDRLIIGYIMNNENLIRKVKFLKPDKSGPFCINFVYYNEFYLNIEHAKEFNHGSSIVIKNEDLKYNDYKDKSIIWQFHHMFITELPIYVKIPLDNEMLNYLGTIS